MLRITDINNSNVVLAKVEKDYWTRKEFITVGYIIKIGDEISYKNCAGLHDRKVLNIFDEIKVDKKINQLRKISNAKN